MLRLFQDFIRRWEAGATGMLSITILLVIGCTSAPPQHPPAARARSTTQTSASVLPAPAETATMQRRLDVMVAGWTGTPHKMGGNGRGGIDCSGFVQKIYKDMFGVRLPRSTASQVRMGTPVSRQDLRPADLVFFRPPQKIRHVGIYMGNGKFAHASTSRGVTVSRLDNPYWRKAYWTSKRILPATKRRN